MDSSIVFSFLNLLKSLAELSAKWRITSWISVGSLQERKDPLISHNGGLSANCIALVLAFALDQGLCLDSGTVVLLEMVTCQQVVDFSLEGVSFETEMCIEV